MATSKASRPKKGAKFYQAVVGEAGNRVVITINTYKVVEVATRGLCLEHVDPPPTEAGAAGWIGLSWESLSRDYATSPERAVALKLESVASLVDSTLRDLQHMRKLEHELRRVRDLQISSGLADALTDALRTPRSRR